ncbi:MAG: DUF2298 domain-containing protein, partial [Candidatus Promineifilaceae bacterium]
AEALFLLSFALWVWIKAQNPAITATEKPMEFAFLNSAGRSPSYPPNDPWLSGYAISYYYFGYVMTSVITRLAGVAEPLGFNLATAWLAAGTALGAFGLIANLMAAGSGRIGRRAITFGLLASVAIPLAGNLEIGLELMHANGAASPQFWTWLDVRDLPAERPPAEAAPRYESSQWWWWRASRVIHEYHLSGQSEEGLEPIAEFPAFSFVLGDLHPHVLALPFALLALAISLEWWLGPVGGVPGGLRFGFAALVLGGLSFLNTWDVLAYLGLLAAVIGLSAWQAGRASAAAVLGRALTAGLALLALAFLLYLPFYLGFRSQAGPPFLLPMVMRPTRLAHYLIIFGLPLAPITVWLAAELLATRKTHSAHLAAALKRSLLSVALLFASLTLLAAALGVLIGLNPEGAARLAALAAELGATPGAPGSTHVGRLGWSLATVADIAPAYLLARLRTPALALTLAALLSAGLALLGGRLAQTRAQPAARRGSHSFVLLLVVAGLLLTLAPEFVYLRDVFGQRLNTIFKFYYQAWLLYGLAAVAGLAHLLRHHRLGGPLAAGIYAPLLLISLLFPIYAGRSRAIEYRGPAGDPSRASPTLDGLAYLQRFAPGDHDAIRWLRANMAGDPVLLEAIGGAYTGYGRVSASTGLPTILGWPGHELQWRGPTTALDGREPAVATLYSSPDWQAAEALLRQYDVSLIYYGPLERSTYGNGGEEKFLDHLEVVYRNDAVTIYRWRAEEAAVAQMGGG